MLTQTWAIFYDAYRSLNAKRLFWIVLAMSGLVVGSFALVGLNERGITVAGFQFPLPPPLEINSQTVPADAFYKGLFAYLGIKYWLSWIATILALVSTGGIFPDLIASGAIDLVLSKPIGRLRLFLTQYAAGLLFVTLQVTVFCAASFVVIGLRGGVWAPSLFVAVPIVVCMFSYLFSVCVLLGVITRSTVAALLLTMLFWLVLIALTITEQSLLLYRTMDKHQVTMATMQGAREAANPEPVSATQEGREENTTLARFHRAFYAMRMVLPKTDETVSLLERSLSAVADIPEAQPKSREEAAGREFEAEVRARSFGWSIGTSLAFEAAVLAIAALLFCRRDF